MDFCLEHENDFKIIGVCLGSFQLVCAETIENISEQKRKGEETVVRVPY